MLTPCLPVPEALGDNSCSGKTPRLSFSDQTPVPAPAPATNNCRWRRRFQLAPVIPVAWKRERVRAQPHLSPRCRQGSTHRRSPHALWRRPGAGAVGRTLDPVSRQLSAPSSSALGERGGGRGRRERRLWGSMTEPLFFFENGDSGPLRCALLWQKTEPLDVPSSHSATGSDVCPLSRSDPADSLSYHARLLCAGPRYYLCVLFLANSLELAVNF